MRGVSPLPSQAHRGETFGQCNTHGRETMGERDKLIIEKINLNEDVLETFG